MRRRGHRRADAQQKARPRRGDGQVVRVRICVEDSFWTSRSKSYPTPPRRYATLRSLCHLAAGQEGEYDLVDECDARLKHVHEKYKLWIDQLGVTWRIVRAAP